MKLVLVFLVSILVAISPRRQSHQQRNGQLWWSKYSNEQPRQQKISLYYDPVDAEIPFFRYSNPIRPTAIYSSQNDEELNHQFGRKQFYMEDNPADDESSERSKNRFLLGQLFGRQQQSEHRKSGLIIPVVARPHQSNNRYVTANRMTADDAMPRIKNYGPVVDGDLSTGNQDPNARFFYLDGSNFLSKTVTISVTSTCTSLSIVSCIPLTSLNPSDPPVNCRRKRAVEMDQIDNDDVSQFQVNPTKVQTVMPTVQPLPVSPSDVIQTPPMTSSMEEKIIDKGDSAKIIENQLRNGRFLKFNFQNFLTYTTITILKSIVTSTLTQTYVPVAELACLPAGYSICPV